MTGEGETRERCVPEGGGFSPDREPGVEGAEKQQPRVTRPPVSSALSQEVGSLRR